ncbi:MAG TPA: pyridoxamine 5'-phosphate oxidase family protein [Candidatus Nanoarchaeia archaeon]|nr:pyridoxamine 5'-phosphate oxidase family protein [Candidatus Nanoarchaeia archaeon]
MEIVKISKLEKEEYDRLIREGCMSRIAFKGEKYPYIAPFLYVFDGTFMYFISTKYGAKIQYFQQYPYVSVEVEQISKDFSTYAFVSLRGRLFEVEDTQRKKAVLEMFVRMIEEKNISRNIMIALGHSPEDQLDVIASEQRVMIWKLGDVEKIIGLTSGT